MTIERKPRGYLAAQRLVERLIEDGCRITVDFGDEISEAEESTNVEQIMGELVAVDECTLQFQNKWVVDAPLRFGAFAVLWDNEPHPFYNSTESKYMTTLWSEVLDPIWDSPLD